MLGKRGWLVLFVLAGGIFVMLRHINVNSRFTSAVHLRNACQPQARACAALPSWLPFVGEKESSMGNKSSSGWQPSGPGQEEVVSSSGYDVTPLTAEERQQAAEKLTDFQRYVTLKAGTERAFSGETVNGYRHDNKEEGIYVDALSGLPLFESRTKFDSGTGWPSFYAPIDPAHVKEIKDTSIPFMPRVEVVSAKSGAHLGHVFPDGPRPTGKRYCMNAAALKFIPKSEFATAPELQKQSQ